MHPCVKRCGFVAIGQSEDSLQNIEQLIDNGVERNLNTVERFEIRILRVSLARRLESGVSGLLLTYSIF
jgi:hypothetical protein